MAERDINNYERKNSNLKQQLLNYETMSTINVHMIEHFTLNIRKFNWWYKFNVWFNFLWGRWCHLFLQRLTFRYFFIAFCRISSFSCSVQTLALKQMIMLSSMALVDMLKRQLHDCQYTERNFYCTVSEW